MWEKIKRVREQFEAQAEADRRAKESDPRCIAKIKLRKLRDRYDLNIHVEEYCFGRLMDILKIS